MAPKRFCHRCGKLVPHNHRHYNREKEKARRNDPNQAAIRGRGSLGRAWRQARATYLAAHPLCQYETGCIERAQHVHHLDGLGPTGPKGLDPTNFQGLCPSHHSQTEAAEGGAMTTASSHKEGYDLNALLVRSPGIRDSAEKNKQPRISALRLAFRTCRVVKLGGRHGCETAPPGRHLGSERSKGGQS